MSCLSVLSKHKESVSQSPQLMQCVVIYNLTMLKGKYIFRRTIVYSERQEMSLSIHRSSLVLLHQSLVRGSI